MKRFLVLKKLYYIAKFALAIWERFWQNSAHGVSYNSGFFYPRTGMHARLPAAGY